MARHGHPITAAVAPAGNAEHEDSPSWRSRRLPLKSRLSATEAPPPAKQTVLVVDDTGAMRGALASIVRQMGYKVLEASDAVKVQRLAERGHRIDLLLLDLSAPETNDLQLAFWFRAIHPETKVLVAASSLWELNLDFGAAQEIALLSKPFTPAELRGMVRRLLK